MKPHDKSAGQQAAGGRMAQQSGLVVGEPYLPGVTSLPEAVQYNFRQGAHELLMWLGSPSREEVRAIRKGRAEFRLLVESGVIFLLYRFEGNARWSDCPYSYHLVPAEQRQLPFDLPTPESRAMLQVLLVDAHTAILKVIRTCSLSPSFSRRLHEAIGDQAVRTDFSKTAYAATLTALYRKYPSANRMAAAAEIACIGGE
jgi:hypothetical protein